MRADYSLRSCPGCAAHLAVPYSTDKIVYCTKCRETNKQTADKPIVKGDRVRERWDEPTRNGSMPTAYIVIYAGHTKAVVQRLGSPDHRAVTTKDQLRHYGA